MCKFIAIVGLNFFYSSFWMQVLAIISDCFYYLLNHWMTFSFRYLHEVCSPPMVHKNIKSSNILLDAELNPHLSDYGFAACHQVNTYSLQYLFIVNKVSRGLAMAWNDIGITWDTWCQMRMMFTRRWLSSFLWLSICWAVLNQRLLAKQQQNHEKPGSWIRKIKGEGDKYKIKRLNKKRWKELHQKEGKLSKSICCLKNLSIIKNRTLNDMCL